MFFEDYKNHPEAKLDPALLWEFDLQKSDFKNPHMRNEIVGKVAGRGRMEDWYFILNFYGEETVRETIKNLAYLNNKTMNFLSLVFDIPKTDMKCYKRKQSRTIHWDS